MEKRKLPKEAEPYKFQKGSSGNPKGRPPSPFPNALRKLTLGSYQKIIKAVFKGNLATLQAIISDPNSSAIEVGLATSAATAIKSGDYDTLDRMASRIIGKCPDVVELNSRNLNINADIDVPREKVKAALEKIKNDL